MKQTIFLTLLLFVSTQIFAQSLLEEAKKLTENEQYEAASAKFGELISREPGNGNNYYFFGENLLQGDNPDSARMAFEKGLQMDPANPLNKIGLAKIKLDEQVRQKVAEAKTTINEVVTSTQQKNARILIEAADALIHLKNKDLDKAKQYLDKAQSLDPKNPEVKILFGDLYTELSNGTLAADYYNQALELDKNSARSIVSKGRLYRRSLNFEGASGEYEKAITVDPNYAPAYRELAEVEFKLGKRDKALENYRKYLDLSKNNCGARISYARALYINRNYFDALTEISQLKEKCDPNNPTVLRITSYCYYELRDNTKVPDAIKKGLEAATKLFAVLPEAKRTATDYEYYGKLQIENKQDSASIEQGIDALRKAYEIDRSKTDLLSVIADAYIKLKKYPDAIKALMEKITIGKDVKTIDYVNLGRSYYYNSQFLESDSSWKKVNELSPTYASGWSGRARANTQLDTSSEAGLAKPFYEKYIELALADSANPAKYTQGLIEAYGYLAYYYILKKDTASALKYLRLKSALPLEPEDLKKVMQAIDQLEGKKPKK